MTDKRVTPAELQAAQDRLKAQAVIAGRQGMQLTMNVGGGRKP